MSHVVGENWLHPFEGSTVPTENAAQQDRVAFQQVGPLCWAQHKVLWSNTVHIHWTPTGDILIPEVMRQPWEDDVWRKHVEVLVLAVRGLVLCPYVDVQVIPCNLDDRVLSDFFDEERLWHFSTAVKQVQLRGGRLCNAQLVEPTEEL